MSRRLISIMIIGFLGSFLACAGNQRAAYRAAYLNAHPDLDPRFKEAIANKRIIPGMNPEMVEASWKPTSLKEFFHDEESGDYFECWYYAPAAFIRSRYGLPQSIYTVVFRNSFVIGVFYEYIPATPTIRRHSTGPSNKNHFHGPIGGGLLGPYKPNAYGPGIWSDSTGRPFKWQTNSGQDVGIFNVEPNAYGPGVEMDQFGRPVYPTPLW